MMRRLTYTSPRSHVLTSTSHMRKALSVPERVRRLRHADEPYKYKGKTVVHGRHRRGHMAVSLPDFLVRPGASASLALKLYPETSKFFSNMSNAVYGVKRVNIFPLDIGLQTGK